jgi:hypothetical protein
VNESVVLYSSREAGSTITVWASVGDDGALRIVGQDLGRVVEELFGGREYEWEIVVRPEIAERLGRVLGWEGDLLAAVVGRFSGPQAVGFRSFLSDHEVPHDFWSRVGD